MMETNTGEFRQEKKQQANAICRTLVSAWERPATILTCGIDESAWERSATVLLTCGTDESSACL